ncbi:MAG: transketolase [Clostridia bacterium]
MVDIENLKKLANKNRKTIIEMIHTAKAGHPGGSLSVIDILTAIYEIDVDFNSEKRSKVILSKGHAVPAQYAELYSKGIILKEELNTFRKINSRLQGHPYTGTIPEVDATTGLLGQGLSIAVGMAIAKKNNDDNNHVYAILGDGEMQEGQIWESLLQAAHYKLDNLIVIIDYNKLSSYDNVNESTNLEPLADKIKAFNFHVIEIDGNDMEQIVKALNEAYAISGMPTVIISNTIKGKGVSFMENNPKWHSGAISNEEYEIAIRELERAEEE